MERWGPLALLFPLQLRLEVSKAPVVAAAAAKLVLGGWAVSEDGTLLNLPSTGCGTTPSTASDSTSARGANPLNRLSSSPSNVSAGDYIAIDPKSGGLLNAAAAAAEACTS